MSTDDSRWWCFVTVGMYACTAENPHPSEHGCGPALNRNGSDVAPVPSPSTDTAGDPNRWTAEVVERWSGRRYHTVVRLSDGNHAAESIGLTATEAESLADHINRPAPDPDLLAEAAVLLRRGLAPSMWRPDGTPEQQITSDEWYERRDAWLALLDAGEPTP